MELVICNLSVIPVRKEASDKSEMITQLLFGEVAEVLKKDKQWQFIRCLHDDYTGWIDEKQILVISQKFYQKSEEDHHSGSLELTHAVLKDDRGFPILRGSPLDTREIRDRESMVEKICFKYLNSPYLWGGRSPFGIDCSGFTQMVYKAIGIPIKRDAYQQIDHGTNIDFVETSKPGDLAFFVNKEGKVIHVGIVIKNQQIIHASGLVRIDKLDNNGIFNTQTKKYTHQLKLIKRLF